MYGSDFSKKMELGERFVLAICTRLLEKIEIDYQSIPVEKRRLSKECRIYAYARMHVMTHVRELRTKPEKNIEDVDATVIDKSERSFFKRNPSDHEPITAEVVKEYINEKFDVIPDIIIGEHVTEFKKLQKCVVRNEGKAVEGFVEEEAKRDEPY